MRLFVCVSALGALALTTVMVPFGAATAAKSKMGCDLDTEVWNATAGKCEAGTSKWRRKATEAANKPAVATKKPAAAKRKPAAKSAPAAK